MSLHFAESDGLGMDFHFTTLHELNKASEQVAEEKVSGTNGTGVGRRFS
jgi:hypothetical protein